MEEVSVIGLDLAKNVFQAHRAAQDGSVVFRRKLTRGHWRGRRRSVGGATRRTERLLAGADDGKKPRMLVAVVGQPHGTRCLGAYDEGWSL
jgi:hypothetical protein